MAPLWKIPILPSTSSTHNPNFFAIPSSNCLGSSSGDGQKPETLHNSIAWPLSGDLTFKVFEELDEESLRHAGACCTLFRGSATAMNPILYSHIVLPSAFEHENNEVLRSRIDLSGKELRCLSLGHLLGKPANVFPSLKSDCLDTLSGDLHLRGNFLRSFHVYNPPAMKTGSLSDALSVCPNLTDLKFVGMNGPVKTILDVIARKCPLIENVFLQYGFGHDIPESIIRALASNCPNLTCLTLNGVIFDDSLARSLITYFPKLKHLDLSKPSGKVTGTFLRDLRRCCEENLLESLILRINSYLKEREVLDFMNSLIAGNFSHLQYLDVSNYDGLAGDGGGRNPEPIFPLDKLKERRPAFEFVADFPARYTVVL